MSASNSDVTVTHKAQLVEHLEAGCRPKSEWRIGTEHEKFGFRFADLRRLDYEGGQGVRALLEGLQCFDWTPVYEDGRPIALKRAGCSITLEPGGQLELSGEQLSTIHETCAEVHEHLRQVKAVAEPLEIGFLGMGFDPKWRIEDMPWMPKRRYGIMRAYMPKRGTKGWDMMARTCTVQVNLDFASEADMVRKFRVGLALQPIATALFANSPFTEERPNGYMSYRSQVWTDTDPDRCGRLPFVFDEGMGFERYVDYMLDVPMYLVHRNGEIVDCSGQSFRAFMRGELPALPGELPTLADWDEHLTTAFPEVRLKRFLEMRGADGGPWASLCALPALWVGLLYDEDALAAAWDMVKDWDAADHDYLRAEVPRLALRTPFHGRTVRELAIDTLKIAELGLQRRAIVSRRRDETQFLDLLWEVAESGQCPAERKLRLYQGRWKGSVDPLFSEFAY